MTGSLAVDVDGIRARLSKFHVDGSLERALAYQPAATDVFIATYPKCGTTLMQQIVHALRSNGDMNFEEISEVVPWIEAMLDLGGQPQDPQPFNPRAFKSHLMYEDVPSGGRNLHVTRDPRDVAVSFYHFFSGWVFDPAHIDIDMFVREYFIGGSNSRRYWDHVVSWWPRLGKQDTLMLAFEDIIVDQSATVRRVADFIGIQASEELIKMVTKKSSIGFMKKHDRQFDDHLIRDARNVAAGLPANAGNSKVRVGKSGEFRQNLSADVLQALDAQWTQVVTASTGLESYEHYRDAIAQQLKVGG